MDLRYEDIEGGEGGMEWESQVGFLSECLLQKSSCDADLRCVSAGFDILLKKGRTLSWWRVERARWWAT